MAARKPVAPAQPRTRLRCAVYTRKSSEEGLEQAFNSLDAQREASLAFVASQKHEGWWALPDVYDDGGFSGGTTERPALQRLLADVAAGKIDVVVVYKVDRLTRSLTDFARIVELFDKHRVSFVSVTQAFNTTTSMGRLTLNVLLSFAQFEREVTGERIRDKIAASKRKGMWMGGQPALGYDVRDRKLVVNEAESATVRQIFRRYVELRSVRELKAELDAAGVVSKQRRAADGSPYGGQPFERGALYHLLANRIYRGEVVHKGATYPGEHAAIVDDALFSEAQTILAGNRVDRTAGTASPEPSLLMGLAFDAEGEAMTPTHAVKKGIRYRHYVSRHLITGSRPDAPGWRLPAPALESLVRNRIGELLGDPQALLDVVITAAPDAGTQRHVMSQAADRHERWPALGAADLRRAMLAFVPRVQIHPDRLEIMLDPPGLLRWLDDVDSRAASERVPSSAEHPSVSLTVPVQMKRRGNELRLVIEGAGEETAANPGLLKLVALARLVGQRLLDDRASIDDVAREEGMTTSYVSRLLRINFLAPDIVARLLTGRHDPALSARQLMADTRFPLDWSKQRDSRIV